MTTKNPEMSEAPLHGLLSTKDVRGNRVIHRTLGQTEGYGQITSRTFSWHGGIEVVLREQGDFTVRSLRHKSKLLDDSGNPIWRGANRPLMKGNLRDIEDGFLAYEEKRQMPLWEHEAHQEYADEQD